MCRTAATPPAPAPLRTSTAQALGGRAPPSQPAAPPRPTRRAPSAPLRPVVGVGAVRPASRRRPVSGRNAAAEPAAPRASTSSTRPGTSAASPATSPSRGAPHLEVVPSALRAEHVGEPHHFLTDSHFLFAGGDVNAPVHKELRVPALAMRYHEYVRSSQRSPMLRSVCVCSACRSTRKCRGSAELEVRWVLPVATRRTMPHRS